MKKIILIAALITVTVISAAKFYFTEQSVEKNIDLSIYKTASYAAPVYNGTYATLKVVVVNESKGKRNIVWQHTYQSVQLKNYPDSNQPLQQKVTIPGVFENKDKLVVYYQLTYKTDSSVLNYTSAERVEKGKINSKLSIQI